MIFFNKNFLYKPPSNRDLSFGHLYTISRSDKEERTYDEPYTGDLPRRSWLCCPGSQHHVECEQPPLLETASKSPSTPSEAITKAPSHNNICSGTCVRIHCYCFKVYNRLIAKTVQILAPILYLNKSV